MVSWLCWFALLWGLWLAFVGTISDPLERIGGFFAAALGATAAEIVRSQGILGYRIERRWLVPALKPLLQVVPEFGTLVVVFFRQLVRPVPHRGAFRVAEFPSSGEDAAAGGRRALVGAAGSLAPNTLVLYAGHEEPLVLVHELVAKPGSGTPLG